MASFNPKIEPFEKYADMYDRWFETYKYTYLSEVEAIRRLMLDSGIGLDIGVGTGRFSEHLGVQYGVDPSPKMLQIAKRRGMDIKEGFAEDLPYLNCEFDYALMVTTVCFIDGLSKPFEEVYRVLRPGGYFINAFIDKDSEIGKIYQENKEHDPFYHVATFHSIDDVVECMRSAGFDDFEFVQTIFNLPDRIESSKEIENPKPDYGEGSFVVVRGMKPRNRNPLLGITSEPYTLLPDL
jgi:ubiquinone/menaquinone biosynthesis C-methylase UbiE